LMIRVFIRMNFSSMSDECIVAYIATIPHRNNIANAVPSYGWHRKKGSNAGDQKGFETVSSPPLSPREGDPICPRKNRPNARLYSRSERRICLLRTGTDPADIRYCPARREKRQGKHSVERGIEAPARTTFQASGLEGLTKHDSVLNLVQPVAALGLEEKEDTTGRCATGHFIYLEIGISLHLHEQPCGL
jgi:hypothetical protein